jgi:hypothetical protein
LACRHESDPACAEVFEAWSSQKQTSESSPGIGQGFYLYLILDLYSRKIVGFTVEATDHSDHAAHLLRRTALAEGIHALPDKPVLHGDNGATLKATTVHAMLHWLGLKTTSVPHRFAHRRRCAHIEAGCDEAEASSRGLEARWRCAEAPCASFAASNRFLKFDFGECKRRPAGSRAGIQGARSHFDFSTTTAPLFSPRSGFVQPSVKEQN